MWRACFLYRQISKNRQALDGACRFLVRVTGVEPARLSAREPKSRMSANSIIPAVIKLKAYCVCNRLLWSGQRGSNSLPPPWQGGALPDELCPHQQRWLFYHKLLICQYLFKIIGPQADSSDLRRTLDMKPHPSDSCPRNPRHSSGNRSPGRSVYIRMRLRGNNYRLP